MNKAFIFKMTENIENQVGELAQRARKASFTLATLSSDQKNTALESIAALIEKRADILSEKNNLDLEAGSQNGLSPALLDRLRLTPERIEGMVEGVRQVAALPDPVGQVIESSTRPNGLDIRKVSVPIGVIGIIYESRPNVTIDCAALCLKSGNASILRGGKEAFHSNSALAELVQEALRETDIPQDAVLLIPTTDR
ncbi:MAG: aldehyde dehydrogenase family protein, partial [Opitutae bacterium]|nr:aldehyde dehydrogenase family protein [Opitutae bacterium]